MTHTRTTDHTSERLQSRKYEAYASVPLFHSLGGNDVITAQVSDHHPLVHDGVLFWNIMMQGKIRSRGSKAGFNNGLGLIENDAQYQERLIKVAKVIAEIVLRDPKIHVIGLCEGPVRTGDIKKIHSALFKYQFMHKFALHTGFTVSDHAAAQWGLFMLADKKYAIKEFPLPHYLQRKELVNRVMLWRMQKPDEEKYFMLAHLPFGRDEHATEIRHLSSQGHEYRNTLVRLKEDYDRESKHLIIAADYNFNPVLVDASSETFGYQIPANNSIVLCSDGGEREEIEHVTVDGILLSRMARQKFHSAYHNLGLFGWLKAENSLALKFESCHLSEKRYHSADLQRSYDKRFGLVLYKGQ